MGGIANQVHLVCIKKLLIHVSFFLRHLQALPDRQREKGAGAFRWERDRLVDRL